MAPGGALLRFGLKEIVRGATEGDSNDPSFNAEVAESEVPCPGTVRVAFGITVLLSLSL